MGENTSHLMYTGRDGVFQTPNRDAVFHSSMQPFLLLPSGTVDSYSGALDNYMVRPHNG